MIDYTYVGRRVTWHNLNKIHHKFKFDSRHSANFWRICNYYYKKYWHHKKRIRRR